MKKAIDILINALEARGINYRAEAKTEKEYDNSAYTVYDVIIEAEDDGLFDLLDDLQRAVGYHDGKIRKYDDGFEEKTISLRAMRRI